MGKERENKHIYHPQSAIHHSVPVTYQPRTTDRKTSGHSHPEAGSAAAHHCGRLLRINRRISYPVRLKSAVYDARSVRFPVDDEPQQPRTQTAAWLLGLPQSRLTVLLAGVAAVWVTVMRIIIVLALSAIAGSIIGLITGKTDPHNLSYALTWLLFSFLLYTLTLTLTLGLMQAEYYLMKSSALSLLLLPIVLLGTLHSVLINRFMIPEDIHSGMMPDWSLLGWIAAIGLPLAACCIFAGAKYYHLILTPQKKAAAQTKQA